MSDLTPTTVQFHYVKSKGFRTVLGDGVFGGPTPNGRRLHFTLFSERTPIPKIVEHELLEGRLGKELSRDGLTGVLREMEMDVLMEWDAVESLRRWLELQLDDAERSGLITRRKEDTK